MEDLSSAVNPRICETHPDFANLLERVRTGKTLLKVDKGRRVFSQGDPANAIYFIESGKVKITSVSADGREAVFAVLGPFAFFGETSLAGQSNWLSSATAVVDSSIFRIEKQVMMKILREQPEFCNRFSAGLLTRIVRLQEDVRAQFFYTDSKKLARILLGLAQLDPNGESDARGGEVTVPRWSHDTLAKMVNASRSHVTRLMNKLRKTGVIDYDGALTVKTKRLRKTLPTD